MNRRIVLSSLSILASTALVVGATFAFFTDEETSKNNIFQAGELDLKIDNTSYYNGQLNTDTSWVLDDLTNQLFFNFTDIKPGDEGEDTVSFHVSNEAWLCADLSISSDKENGINENELEDGDTTDDGQFDGELGDELNFVFWADDGDNVLEVGESVLTQGNASSVMGGATYALADASGNLLTGEAGPLVPGAQGDMVYYLGKAWCFGELGLEPVGVGVNPTVASGVTCNGSELDNKTQSDMLVGDITFRAVQARSNPEYVCDATGRKTVLGLDNKTAEWEFTPGDEINGQLTFNSSYPTFKYDLEVSGLVEDTSYTLIYYPDPWPGSGAIELGSFVTDASGNVVTSGDREINTSLPVAGDDNSPGAKLWVILSSDWGGDGVGLSGWSPTSYLFEENLVTYEDTDS